MGIGLPTFARYAIICIIGGLMIGYGCAWTFSTPLITTTFTRELVSNASFVTGISPTITERQISPETGLIMMLLMFIAGTAIAAVFKYLPPMVHEWLDPEEEGE